MGSRKFGIPGFHEGPEEYTWKDLYLGVGIPLQKTLMEP